MAGFRDRALDIASANIAASVLTLETLARNKHILRNEHFNATSSFLTYSVNFTVYSVYYRMVPATFFRSSSAILNRDTKAMLSSQNVPSRLFY